MERFTKWCAKQLKSYREGRRGVDIVMGMKREGTEVHRERGGVKWVKLRQQGR